MQLIIIPNNSRPVAGNGNHLLRFAISNEPIASVIFTGLNKGLPQSRLPHLCSKQDGKVVCAIPEKWRGGHLATTPKIITYRENVPICSRLARTIKRNIWFGFSNGRFATQINNKLLDKVLTGTQADILAVNAKPDLLAYHEKIRLTTQNKVAGIRRFYSDSAEPIPLPTDWPHYTFVKTNVFDQVLVGHTLPASFSAFVERCWSIGLTVRAINVAGVVLDLETEDDLLNFCRTTLSKIRNPKSEIRNSNTTSQNPRIIGKVLLGKNVHISPKVVLIGPTLIGNNVTIEQGAIINSSIIGPNVLVPRNQFVQNCVVKPLEGNAKRLIWPLNNRPKQLCHPNGTNNTFRDWPRFSYARCFKRIADCFAAIIMLILFAPIMPFVALAIKLTSPGPVFFKDKRQGLHSKEFYCLKFRSMIVGADKIQNKLRVVSQVDGPQFKITDDPRLSGVGKFLRDTCLDEIPQFVNVLLGQMSVVGPRPSPESENILCPYWRDARLSVRPGITGLWQICRTRQPMKDFQEWIHYDIQYVRNLSLKMDLWICWQTAKKLIKNFVSQF